MEGATICEPCAEGYYQNEMGAIECKMAEPCPVGLQRSWYSETDAPVCDKCLEGTYKDFVGTATSKCKMCQVGQY